MTRTVQSVDFTLDDRAFRTDPYERYRQLREDHRIFWHDGYDAYVVPHYDDVAEVLRGTRWQVRPGSDFLEKQHGANETVDQLMQGFYYFLDEPAHRRLRNVVSTTFTPRIVSGFRPRIQEIADELLEESLGRRGEMEFMSDLAYPMTIRVITEILGATTAEDQVFFHQHAAALAGLLEWDAPPARVAAGGDAMLEISTRFVDILEARLKSPANDLVSSLIEAHAEGRASDSFEIIFMCVLLTTVGYETTMNHLGNGMHALLSYPDQFSRLRNEPEIVPRAVDELLRYEAPVQVTARKAMEDIEVAGTTIGAGEMVVVLLGGANRDSSVFPDPDRLDLTRTNASRHMTFAHGPHFCLGAALAKAEGEILFSTMAQRYPDVHFAGVPQWRDTAILRSLEHLPLALPGRGVATR